MFSFVLWYVLLPLLFLRLLQRLWKYLNPKKVQGDVFFISGAGSGLGRRLALTFAQLGGKIAVVDLNRDAATTVAEEIVSAGGVAIAVECDVSDAESVHRAGTRVRSELGEVSFLVNNAGIVAGRYVSDPSLEVSRMKKVVDVNTVAHFYTVKEFLSSMISRNHGHIITIASAAAFIGVSRASDYCASKAGAFMFDESLRMELSKQGHSGIHTTCICPFYINTGMFQGVKTRRWLDWLLPILDEKEVAESIVRAVRENQEVLCLPWIVYTVPLFRFLLPPRWFDFVAAVLGINSSMDDFIGREVPTKSVSTPNPRAPLDADSLRKRR